MVASLSIFGNADRGRSLLFGMMARLLPAIAVQLITKTFDEILRSTGPLKMSVGIVFSLWSASMGMNAVMDTLNAAYNVEESCGFLKRSAVAIGLTLVLTILLVSSTLLVIVGDEFARRFGPVSFIRLGWNFSQWPLALVVLEHCRSPQIKT